MIAVIVFLLQHRATPLTVGAVQVAAQPASPGCDTTVDVVGTVTTDGRGGTLHYQWLRSDGQTGEVLAQSVGSGTTSTQVHLAWTVSGHGRFEGRATLRVLDATGPAEGSGTFVYSCR